MRGLALIVSVTTAVFTCQLQAGSESGTVAEVVQAFAGISQGNGTLPCANPGGANGCYGVPNGSVALQPYHFIPPNQREFYYAVFQTGNWGGTLGVTFEIVEANVVIQTVAAPVVTVSPNSVVLVSMAEAIPDNNGYVGPAKLTATTTATPAGGGTPVALKSSVALEVVKHGASLQAAATLGPGILQVIAGISQYLALSGAMFIPCVTGDGFSCFGLPAGALALAPYQVLSNTPTPISLVYLTVFQTENWEGTVSSAFQLLEGGTVVQTGGSGGTALPISTMGFGTGYVPPVNGYVGPAGMNITTTATAVQRGSNRTLHGSTELKIIAAP